MSTPAPRRGRGRGRNKDVSASATPVASPGPAARSPSPAAEHEDAQMDDAPEGDDFSPAPVAAAARRGRSTTGNAVASGSGAASARARPVGGLLGESEYAKKPAGAATTATKRKFVPNKNRKTKVVKSDDDEDVKMEDDFKFKRGAPRPRAARQELVMTASGPMAQGPGGAPKSFGAKTFHGAAGAGVMNASREGRLRGQFEEQHAEDDSDLEEGSDNDEGTGGYKVFARELDLIGGEDEMAPITLPRDPKVVEASKERRKIRQEKRIKEEAKPAVKPEPMDDDAASIMLSSATGTPALEVDSKSGADSKEASLAPGDDIKTGIKLEEPEPDLSRDFDLPPDSSEQIYMFQFPRRFPQFVVDTPASNGDAAAPEIKMEDGTASAGPRKKQAPDWGRIGPRANKASRWATEEGQIGELLVHKSGKITLVINDDLSYEVLPAADPSFLQEVVVLDHDPASEPRPAGSAPVKSEPNHSLLTIGQTRKKYMVVPQIDSLLEKVELQEKEEKRAALVAKAGVKKEKKEH